MKVNKVTDEVDDKAVDEVHDEAEMEKAIWNSTDTKKAQKY